MIYSKYYYFYSKLLKSNNLAIIRKSIQFFLKKLKNKFLDNNIPN